MLPSQGKRPDRAARHPLTSFQPATPGRPSCSRTASPKPLTKCGPIRATIFRFLRASSHSALLSQADIPASLSDPTIGFDHICSMSLQSNQSTITPELYVLLVRMTSQVAVVQLFVPTSHMSPFILPIQITWISQH